MANIQGGSVGRMSLDPTRPIKEKTSNSFSKRSSASSSRMPRCLCLKRHDGPTPTFTWETDGASRTVLLMHNTGEFPSEDAASTLSQILQAEVPEKYYLSQNTQTGLLTQIVFFRHFCLQDLRQGRCGVCVGELPSIVRQEFGTQRSIRLPCKGRRRAILPFQA